MPQRTRSLTWPATAITSLAGAFALTCAPAIAGDTEEGVRVALSASRTVTITESTDTAIPLDAAARVFEEARSLSAADGGRLWGTPLYGPLLFADRNTRWVVANQSDEEGFLGERAADQGRATVFVGRLTPEQNVANTAMEWGGVRWTMLAWPLPENTYDRGQLLCHEMFHRIQGSLGLPPLPEDNRHLGTREGRVWLRLEMRALAAALARGGDDREVAIADAALFRGQRRLLFPDRADDERALELNEGLSEYTGLVMSGLPADSLPDRAAAALNACDASPSVVRSFAYATGPAYGLLLDAAALSRPEDRASWREALTPETDLVELLLAAEGIETLRSPSPSAPGDSRLSAPGSALAQTARLRMKIYDGDAVMAEEDRHAAEAAAREAAFHARFIDGPILVLPQAAETQYAFDPHAVETMGEDGTVFLTARVTDMWGALEVTSGGVLMIRRGGIVEKFVVPSPIDPKARPLTGDGWALDLDVGWALAPGERDGDYTVVIR